MIKTLKIEKIIQQNSICKSFLFRNKELSKARPGQFYMVWVPGVDEFPMGASYIYPEKEMFGITVWSVGPGTDALHKKKEGDFIGIRGPYGNGFSPQGKKIVCVVGAAEEIIPIPELWKDKEVTLIYGVAKAENVIFKDRLKNFKTVLYASEDGSIGEKGSSIDILSKLLERERFDYIYTCGSEQFLLKVAEVAEKFKIPAQLCGGRYMKCGIGICGSCVCDNIRTCKDVVIDIPTLKKLKEFGKITLDRSGKAISQT